MNQAQQHAEHILENAITCEASDIHFCPYGDNVYIYFRINGKRQSDSIISSSDYAPLLSYFKFTSGMDIGEILKPQNGISHFQAKKTPCTLRLSTLPVNSTESLAIRILPQERIPQLHQLFMFPYQLQRMKKWITNQSGIIVFTGPTGSGKTTTLYALLSSLLQEKSYQTITLEDPIEQELQDILQVQVNEKAGIDYNAGLKAALRHDPDIIMVGEIRDKKTAEFAFHAAHTGHLVLTTLHAKNAYGTIFRLLEMGISKTDLEQTLISIASQQLLPTTIANPHEPQRAPHRAAILELLEGSLLRNAINGDPPQQSNKYRSFSHLRRKAYALGYISQESI
ncbi:competence type IV pilus ATPase ComGA [Pontibacillus marinus]|uniref:Competence protein n=1 Tax=Pontibacillus marinus BH030004 = DSM 16465 TaxID=1385511 RepID=A0A0A5G1S9_9BACI|nr:competence type IV pilus ATPase ComGA [Pontibacillus marinus]KGX85005.1 competence protein [Pontibacillus marinus BH030004 = DSM 16465]